MDAGEWNRLPLLMMEDYRPLEVGEAIEAGDEVCVRGEWRLTEHVGLRYDLGYFPHRRPVTLKYQWRAREELRELNERRCRLDEFMTNGVYHSLAEEERILIGRQARAMADYASALAGRIALWERAAKESAKGTANGR